MLASKLTEIMVFKEKSLRDGLTRFIWLNLREKIASSRFRRSSQ